MIYFSCGRPGDGKSRWGIERIFNHMRYDTRPVVTNRNDIEWGRLNEYLQERLGNAAPNLAERLRVIDRSDTQEFYRFRGYGVTLPKIESRYCDDKLTELAEWNLIAYDYFSVANAGVPSGKQIGVIYEMEEAHTHFPSKSWRALARPITYYSTQHRHLCDDWWLVSQNPEQVEITLRRLVNEWWRIQNRYRMTYMGVQYPAGFVVEGFNDEPGTGRKCVPFRTTKFALDEKGLASCYRTTGALGAAGIAPEPKPRKGVPFWVVWPVLGVFAIALWGLIAMVPTVAGRVMSGLMGGVKKGVEKGIQKPDTKKNESPSVPVQGVSVQAPPGGGVGYPPLAESPPMCVGLVRGPGDTRAYLSDGRILSKSEHTLLEIRLEGVVGMDGRKYLFGSRKVSEKLTFPPKS